MDNELEAIENDPLARPLQSEARLMRPKFSAALDARLRAAIQAAVPPAAPAGLPAQNDWRHSVRGRLLPWAIAAAASVALLVASPFFRSVPPTRRLEMLPALGQVGGTVCPAPAETVISKPKIEPALPPNDDLNSPASFVGDTASGLGQWISVTVDENQWAGLDRDAQTAMATVTSPLPFDLSGEIAAAGPAE